MVLFGTPAEFIFDINFIIQIVLIILSIIGYTQKRTWKYRGIILSVATLTILATILLIMAPCFILPNRQQVSTCTISPNPWFSNYYSPCGVRLTGICC